AAVGAAAGGDEAARPRGGPALRHAAGPAAALAGAAADHQRVARHLRHPRARDGRAARRPPAHGAGAVAGRGGGASPPRGAADVSRCFQLMECDDVTLFQRWVAEWSDLMEFEIVPVVAGKDTGAALAT